MNRSEAKMIAEELHKFIRNDVRKACLLYTSPICLPFTKTLLTQFAPSKRKKTLLTDIKRGYEEITDECFKFMDLSLIHI